MKLILATSLVVAAAVGMSTWFSQTSIQDLTEKQVKARRESGEASISRESQLVVQGIAQAEVQAVSLGVVPEVQPIIDAALKDDARVSWISVSDTQQVIATAAKPGVTAPVSAALAAMSDKLGTKDGVATIEGATKTDTIYGIPIKSGANTVGFVRMGVSTAALEADLAKDIASAKAKAAEIRNRIWMVSIVVLAIGIVLSALQAVQLSRPIRQLTVQAQRIAGGDLQARVSENRGDELGVLARGFNLMANEIQHLLVDQAQKASLEREMSLARGVQQAMLPPHTLDQHGYLKIVGYCMPATSCGGDWWTYRKMSDGRMLIVVGDATGHGIHSAMIAATARGAVEALSGIDERLLTPDQVLRAIDSAIRQVGDHNVLMTAFAALFDSATGSLYYANAGQNFPYIVKLGATRLLEDASIIAASGNPLGDRNIPVEIRKGSVQLRPGDLFVCFTDGLVERANPAGKLFGDRRLRGAFTGQPLADGNALVRLRDQLVTTVDRYGEGALPEDDITLVLCQYDPPAVGRRDSVARGAA